MKVLSPKACPGLTLLARHPQSCGLSPARARQLHEGTEPWGAVVQVTPPPLSWKSRMPGGVQGQGAVEKLAGQAVALIPA